MKRISTHILDLTLGKPAPDVSVRLERREPSDGSWHLVSSACTDPDGRCAQLLPETVDLFPGLYRLAFDTASYYAAQRIETLYPAIEITFRVRNGESQFHIPLLLSPNGFSTYRGS